MRNALPIFVAAAMLAAAATTTQADVITDWNLKTGQIVIDSKLGTPPAIRVVAVVQTAAHEAVRAAQRRPTSVEAAVAAAHRTTLLALVPSQQAAIEQAYQGALAPIVEGPLKAGGIAAGERAAAAVLAARADGKTGTQRSAEQTEIARFWEYSLPAIYHGVVRSVALAPGRDVASNARLFAAVAQAMDDAMISVFDAKYHYQFWRPLTAIRNGDADGHDGTARDASWTPLIDNPMHPEYPSAHSILASAVGTVLKAEVGTAPMPMLATTSPTAAGATRRWTQVDDFVREVANARVYEGVHYRFSTEVGTAMGRQIGALTVARLLAPPQ